MAAAPATGGPPARRSSPTGCRSCGRTSTWSVHPTWSDFATPCGASTRTRFRAVVDEVARGLAGPLPDAHTRAAEGSPADVLLRESHGGPAGRGQPWARRLPHHAARLDEYPACVMCTPAARSPWCIRPRAAATGCVCTVSGRTGNRMSTGTGSTHCPRRGRRAELDPDAGRRSPPCRCGQGQGAERGTGPAPDRDGPVPGRRPRRGQGGRADVVSRTPGDSGRVHVDGGRSGPGNGRSSPGSLVFDLAVIIGATTWSLRDGPRRDLTQRRTFERELHDLRVSESRNPRSGA